MTTTSDDHCSYKVTSIRMAKTHIIGLELYTPSSMAGGGSRVAIGENSRDTPTHTRTTRTHRPRTRRTPI